MLDSMADAFLALDASSTVVYLNRAAERLLGTGPGAVGRNLWEVWPALVEAGHDRVFEAAVEMVETRVLTTYLAAEARWFQLRVVPADDGSGSLSVFGTDITAARTAELEQERGLARPEQARRVLAYTRGPCAGRLVAGRHRHRGHHGAPSIRCDRHAGGPRRVRPATSRSFPRWSR